jgi:hypothetical protein
MGRQPVIYVTTLGHSAHLIEWFHRPDGWWAHIHWLDFADNPGWSKRRDTFEEHELWVHASLTQPRTGWDYSQVPRR